MVRRLYSVLCFAAIALGVSGCASDPTSTASLSAGDGGAALIGLDRRALESHWGQPMLLRSEGPGEMWQYRSVDCVVDIFFYPATDALRVAHLTVRPADRSPTRCLHRPPHTAGFAG